MILSGTFLDAASGMRHAGAGKPVKSPRPQRRPTTGSNVHHLHPASSFRLSTSLEAVRQGHQSQNSTEQVPPKYQTISTQPNLCRGHQCLTCLAQLRGANRADLLDLNQGQPSICWPTSCRTTGRPSFSMTSLYTCTNPARILESKDGTVLL